MNLLTLRSQARLKSGVNVTDFTAANLDEQLNVAYYQLASFISELDDDYYEEQNDKFNLAQNSALYSLPTDYMKIKQVRLAYSTPSTASDYKIARHYDPKEVRNVSADEESVSTQYPIYDITNNYIRIKPTPTSAVTNGGRLWYIARPSALTLTGDSPILPLQYHDYLATWAAKEMTFKFQKWAKYDRLKLEWNEAIANLQKDLADRDLGSVMRFRSPFEADVPVSARLELPDE